MDIITAASVLLIQVEQMNNMANQLQMMAGQINTIANQEEPAAYIKSRIGGLIAAMDVQMVAIGSQNVLIQQAIDELANIIK